MKTTEHECRSELVSAAMRAASARGTVGSPHARRRNVVLRNWIRVVLVFGLGLLSRGALAADEKLLIEWKFAEPDNFLGWTIGGLVEAGAVRDGALHGRASGSDPILFSPQFEVPAGPDQCIDICVKCTSPALAELYWTETLQGQYGGFSPEKYRQLHVSGDGQYRVYRIWPFWQTAGKIIRLRFDPPNAGEFDIQSIRIVELPARSSDARSWQGPALAEQWLDAGDADGTASAPIRLSPELQISASANRFVCVRMATRSQGSGRLYAVSDQKYGWEAVSFPLRADGKLHSYNVPAASLGNWKGNIVRLGLQVPVLADTQTQIESIDVAAEPSGPPELELTYFGPTDGIQRAGRPTRVSCTLQNRGGQLAENVQLTLRANSDVQITSGATQSIDQLSLYLPKTVDWVITSSKLGKLDLNLDVTGPGADVLHGRTTLNLTQVPKVAASDYVPEPQPVRSDYEIGAFYFPGFPTANAWAPIRNYPNRKPILGWYDESNPECADWQIKWSVEHGINFYLVDWYWCQGNRQLDHWLRNAYGKARYKKYLKWAVMWANHNAPNTHSAEDWRKVTQYWIDNYFQTPEYYQIEGKPAVFIWAPSNIRGDVGGTEQAAKLYAMSQEMAKAAGLKGIYFAAMSAHESPEQAKLLLQEGYEGATTYHGFQLAWQRAQSDRFPYADLLDTCPEVWSEAEKTAAGLLYMPIVDTGWDARPWHGEKSIVAYDRTPEEFGKLCQLARDYADRSKKKIIILGPLNEWGEGSYIEPYAEYGFQDLDQVRAAFCQPGAWPPNVIPADVNRGPYDLPALAAKTDWGFEDPDALVGWMPNSDIVDLAVRDGALQGHTIGRDPIIQVPGLEVEAHRLHRLKFRYKANRDQRIQIFWATTMNAMDGDASLGLQAVGDGQYHDYEVDLATNPRWQGVISILRIDPATEPDVQFAFDSIHLE